MKYWKNFWNTLKELENTQSIVEKTKIFESVKNDEETWKLLKKFFQLCFDKNLKFGIKSISEENVKEVVSDYIDPSWFIDLKTIFEVVDNINFEDYGYAKKRKKKLTPTQFLNNLSKLTLTQTEFNILERILARDPRCNIGRELYEKYFEEREEGEFVPKCMKATSYSEKALSKIKFPCFVQHKLDGSRCLIDVSENNEVKIYSGNGGQFFGLERLELAIQQLHANNSILDGEILVFDNTWTTPLDRKTGNGILNKSLQKTLSRDEGSQVGIVLWDFIDRDEYEAEKGSTPYKERFEKLQRQIGFLTERDSMVKLVTTHVANSRNEVLEIFAQYLSEGAEGVIVKNQDGNWSNSRPSHQCKLKQEFVVSLKVVDFEYGSKNSKYETKIGALCCESSDGLLKVNVGSGMKDEDRENFESFVGAIIDVKANGVIQSKDERKPMSLFLPRFVCIRNDKSEPDSKEYILQQDVCWKALNKEN